MTVGGVRLIGLGGTISMRDGERGAVPFLGAAALADRVGGFAAAADLALVGGSEVGFDLLERLVAAVSDAVAADAAGVVVTTGTDSIEEVSAWLSYRRRWPVPVVVTGSMVLGSRPDTDGPANLADARTVATSGADVDPVVVFGGRVFSGREAVKVSGVARDAFDAPGRGPLAVVGGGDVRWHRTPTRGPAQAGPLRAPVPVPIVLAALDDDGRLLRLAGEGQRGLVVAANGAGNLPARQAVAARELAAGGVLVVVTTRAYDGRLAPRYGYPGGGAELASAGVQFASGLTPHRARLLLALGIARGLDHTALRDLVASEAEPASA